uniref:Ycf1 protein n=1 Tax=Cuscuta polyanthemos TaxID=437288 RepID=UPI002435C078|nr:Ycf1 protein [Cuscuta polyanthemos]WEY30461.1 Ycf1 protein [Cuscuta polyanthemos]
MNLQCLVKLVAGSYYNISSSILSKIIHSVILVGLYYGFLTALALKTSYILLIRAMVRENPNHKAAAITGLILGQLGRFLSIYYEPLYIAFGRPYTLTVITLLYFLVNLFGNNLDTNESSFGAYGNAIRTLEISCIFLNNLLLHFLNTFIFPSSTLYRVVNIYLFRCNNKIVFLISSFCGWLIGQILVLKGFQLVVGWVQNKNSIKALIQQYLVRNSIFLIALNCLFGSSLFILTIQSLGRIPFPLPTQKLSKISRIERREEERLKKAGVAKKDKSTEDEDNLSHKNDDLKKEPYFKLEDEYVEKDIEQAIGTLLFDYKRWTRPFRYIKNNQFEQSVRNEMSQYFFATHQSDGKYKICFTYPVNLSLFWKSIAFWFQNKNCSDTLNKHWVDRNKKKFNSLKIDLFNRIKNLDRTLGIEYVTTRTRLCLHQNETKQEYLVEEYDPLLNGLARGKIKKEKGFLSKKETDTSIKIFENKTNDQHIQVNLIAKEKLTFGDKITKKVPQWSYKLITELEQLSYYRNPPEDHDIRTRKAKSLVIFDPSKHPNMQTIENNTSLKDDSNNKNSHKDSDNDNPTKKEPKDDKRYSIRYSHQSDFRHGLIKNSLRPLRRKIVITDLFNGNVHSPLFFERRTKKNFFSLLGLVQFKRLFLTWSTRKKVEELETTNKQKRNKEKKRQEAKERIEIAEAWDTFELTQALRGFLLVTQSSLRKNIILPLLIIVKNIGRLLLFQSSEWSEDFEELEKETHIPCTYNGIPLGEKEFPRNWLTEGIQIKILSPFCLQPWKEEKKPVSASENFCFLTIWGQETDQIFGRPRKRFSFFKPILIQLDNSIGKINILLFSQEKRPLDPNIMKKEKEDLLSNKILNKPLNQFGECEKIETITTRISIIKNKLEKITKDTKKIALKFNMSFRQKSFKSFKFKRKKTKLIYNLPLFKYFLKSFIQQIYNIFLFNIVSICQLINQLFYKAKANLIDKWNFNNEKNKKGPEKFNFLLNRKIQQNVNNLCHLSQAYVFYKISQQPEIFNILKLNSVLNNQGTSVFSKNKIKESFATQSLIQTEIINKKFTQIKTCQWKNWLRSNAQYNLSHIIWLSFNIKKQKWRKFNKKSSNTWNFSRNVKLKESKKVNFTNLILNKHEKENFEKCYRYDLLSSQFISLNLKKKSRTFGDKLLTSVSKPQTILYNKKMSQNFLFALTKNICVKNLIGKIEKVNIPYREKNLDRKYLTFENIHFSLKKKVNIESWIPLLSRSNPMKIYNYELLDEMEVMDLSKQIFKKEKELLVPCIEQNDEKMQYKSKNSLIDWMGLNQELLNNPVTNLEFWFFPEFVSVLNIYKLKPWILQSQFLLSKVTLNKITGQQQIKTKNKKKNTMNNQKNHEINNKQKNKPDNEETDEPENQQNEETEEDPQLAYIIAFLKKHLLFQLKVDFIFKKSGFKNIQILCILLRLMNQNEMLLSSIKNEKLNLHVMPEIGIKELTLEVLEEIGVPEFLKEKALNFEPLPLAINKNGKFLMYQLINISLVNKIKYPITKKYQKPEKIKTVNYLLPENILSSRCRRELRILLFLTSNINQWKENETNLLGYNKKWTDFWDEQKKAIDFFIWPNYRLEDLACINRYWFYTNNGSCFSMLRILMYLPLKSY